MGSYIHILIPYSGFLCMVLIYANYVRRRIDSQIFRTFTLGTEKGLQILHLQILLDRKIDVSGAEIVLHIFFLLAMRCKIC